MIPVSTVWFYAGVAFLFCFPAYLALELWLGKREADRAAKARFAEAKRRQRIRDTEAARQKINALQIAHRAEHQRRQSTPAARRASSRLRQSAADLRRAKSNLN